MKRKHSNNVIKNFNLRRNVVIIKTIVQKRPVKNYSAFWQFFVQSNKFQKNLKEFFQFIVEFLSEHFWSGLCQWIFVLRIVINLLLSNYVSLKIKHFLKKKSRKTFERNFISAIKLAISLIFIKIIKTILN